MWFNVCRSFYHNNSRGLAAKCRQVLMVACNKVDVSRPSIITHSYSPHNGCSEFPTNWSKRLQLIMSRRNVNSPPGTDVWSVVPRQPVKIYSNGMFL